MKRVCIFMCLLVGFACNLSADIFEASHFSDIVSYVKPHTLVIVDIDDTLLVPVQTLGTDVWFGSQLQRHLKEQNDSELALDKTLAEWEAIRHITQIKIVEEGTDQIINNFQDNHIAVLGLTTQGLALATRSVMQLKSLNIDLSRTAPFQEDHYLFNKHHGVLYRKGILFTSGTSKGTALVKLMDMMDYHPQHIVFIDDKKSHLLDVEKHIAGRGIEFSGFRYNFSDERVANYSQEIADYQWSHSTLDHLLSDEEAIQQLNYAQ